MPICEQVFAITYEGKNPKAAVYELMTRSPKPELK
jgi:glycerol-3-phosphate dehydrogenase (NAD(P)+)